ncbi:hypothetical protein AgCh_023195 [Apium graveolens]
MKIPQILIKPVCKLVQVTDDTLAEDEDVQTLKRRKISEVSKATYAKLKLFRVKNNKLQNKQQVLIKWKDISNVGIRCAKQITERTSILALPFRDDGSEISIKKDYDKLEVIMKEKCLCYNEDSSHPKIVGEAFETVSGFVGPDDDGIEILQGYSKEIIKRMLETMKVRSCGVEEQLQLDSGSGVTEPAESGDPETN